VPTDNITRTCAQCGALNEFDRQPGDPRIVTCSACMMSWDQDANACVNMLSRAKAQLEAPQDDTAKKPARSQILRRRKKGGDLATDIPTS
ncbi:MAG TPA: zinc ribbon domain-containing protein, partial [Haliangium sp.]|nr:zinc ribbon domain-containing protein [Haliangium sp.]